MHSPLPVDAPRIHGPHLAEVVSIDDPEGLARVQVKIHGRDADGDAPLWARVVAPFAGAERGAFFIPDVGDEVVVSFLAGDPRAPVVLGGVWNGEAPPPEDILGSVDRWTITGKAGTRIAILEDGAGRERVEIETPNGAKAVVTDQGGGRVRVSAGGSRVTINPSGVSIETGATVSVDAAAVSISTGIMNVDCGFTSFSGVIQCSTLITNSVVSSSYTPGAGNIW